MPNQEENILDVEIYWSPSKRKESFKGKALSISSKNKLGVFDILPKHANFITLIYDFLIVRTIEGKTFQFTFERGVLEVAQNRVKIFLEI